MVQIEKEIESVSINYKDGTKEVFDFYAAVGHSGDTWFKVVHFPHPVSDKIILNNHLVELVNTVFKEVC